MPYAEWKLGKSRVSKMVVTDSMDDVFYVQSYRENIYKGICLFWLCWKYLQKQTNNWGIWEKWMGIGNSCNCNSNSSLCIWRPDLSIFEIEHVIRERWVGSFPKTQVASSLRLSLRTPRFRRNSDFLTEQESFYFKTTTTSSCCSDQSSKMAAFKF